MRNLLLIVTLLFGCTIDDNVSDKDTSPDTSYPSVGIVSTDPPGADDWADDTSDSTDSADSSEPDSDSGSDSGDDTGSPLESYDGCSNVIEMWTEPDPLNHPCNFRLQDQNGDYVELYDFQGDVILLDFSTMWCSVCKTVAGHVQEMHDDYTPFSAITILTENTSGETPSIDDLQAWVTEYNITTAPVLTSDDSIVGTEDDLWNVNGIPCFFVIDKDFYLRKIQPGWNETTTTEYIKELVAE